MNSSRPIVHITNFPPRPVSDGGSHREEALASFLESQEGVRLVVQDESFHSNKTGRLTRISGLLRQIRELNPLMVVLNYPSYPFVWRHRVTPYFAASVAFTLSLRRLADSCGFPIVIDVMDLPAFQYEDLGFDLEMRPETLMKFDRFIFNFADYLWVCSGSISLLINERYRINRRRTIVALNGYNVEKEISDDKASRTLQIGYAGSLNLERGIDSIVSGFLSSCPANTQLHLCGMGGNRIRERYDSPRVIYHGELSDSLAAETLSDCDIGLIPYPEKGYYNIAFATKLAFYLGIGIPVLCSRASETAGYVENLGIGICASIREIPDAITQLSKRPDAIAHLKRRVEQVRRMFSWTNIYSSALEETLRRESPNTKRHAS